MYSFCKLILLRDSQFQFFENSSQRDPFIIKQFKQLHVIDDKKSNSIFSYFNKELWFFFNLKEVMIFFL